MYFEESELGLALLVMVVGCGKDNGGSDKSVPDPEGTVTIAMRNESNGHTIVLPDGCSGFFLIGSDNNFYTFVDGDFYGCRGMWTFASVGKVSGLANIKQIPTSGWSYMAAVMPGYGYVAKCENYESYDSGNKFRPTGTTTYVRIYVVDYITTAGSGGVIGANVKYQSPFKP